MRTPLPKVTVDQGARWWAQSAAIRLGPDRAARLIGISRAAMADVCAGFDVWPTVAAKVTTARERDFRRVIHSAA